MAGSRVSASPNEYRKFNADRVIQTLQHPSGWKYGDNFISLDVLESRQPGFRCERCGFERANYARPEEADAVIRLVRDLADS